MTGCSTTAMAGNDCFSIVTYNLHGLNNGRCGLIDLCNNPLINVIAIQEHWLSDNNVHLLNNIHPEFAGFGISSMSRRLQSEVYYGRPYGGVGFLWRKTLGNRIKTSNKAESGRCLAIELQLDSSVKVNLITAYFPCYNASVTYNVDLDECLSFIEDVIGDGCPAVILGDMNFQCDASNKGYRQCYNVLSNYGIFHCDDFLCNGICNTYHNYSLNQSSFIDHVFVSDSIRHSIINAELHDTGVNLSDHIPVVYSFNWSVSAQVLLSPEPHSKKYYSWRWDKSDLNYYYQCTDQLLRAVHMPSLCDCKFGCINISHLHSINQYYENIVAALHHAASTAICQVPCNSLKPYWIDELDNLKSDSIFWHNLWTQAGRPSSGVLHRIRLSCKAKYKLAIRAAYANFENKLSEELSVHFMKKNIPDFWKTWNSKFKKNVCKRVNLDGCTNDEETANKFAAHFNNVFCKSSDDTSAYDDYLRKRSECLLDMDNPQCSYECIDKINVEVIEQSLKRLKFGKAAGPDDLCAENVHYAHPALIVHLKQLFKLILIHGFVPNSFGVGLSVPLVKDKAGNINNMDNYRAITLSPIISKLFEIVLLHICDDVLDTDALQFGFKDKIGCADAIFTLKSTLEYFVKRGSSVYIASLDISKAFDRVNHYKLYNSLLCAGVPVVIVDVLYNWYSKLVFAVRWNNSVSVQFSVGSGVRQGSCLSPAVFNVFMNCFIVQLKALRTGCHVTSLFIGCILYADDILLISPSVNGLQKMLDKCSEVASDLSLSFNVLKSHCIAVGKLHKCIINPMTLCGNSVDWCSSIKYLGIHILGGKHVKFDINPCKRAFYAACNSIFTYGCNINELALLSLQESYSLSILMYAAPALSLSNRQIDELGACWNSVIRRIFGYGRTESVKAVLLGLGRLNVKHLIMERKIKFFRHLWFSENNIMHNIFISHLLYNSDSDCMLRSVFWTLSNAFMFVSTQFESYVG